MASPHCLTPRSLFCLHSPLSSSSSVLRGDTSLVRAFPRLKTLLRQFPHLEMYRLVLPTWLDQILASHQRCTMIFLPHACAAVKKIALLCGLFRRAPKFFHPPRGENGGLPQGWNRHHLLYSVLWETPMNPHARYPCKHILCDENDSHGGFFIFSQM